MEITYIVLGSKHTTNQTNCIVLFLSKPNKNVKPNLTNVIDKKNTEIKSKNKPIFAGVILYNEFHK
jgi:hypothetical protein